MMRAGWPLTQHLIGQVPPRIPMLLRLLCSTGMQSRPAPAAHLGFELIQAVCHHGILVCLALRSAVVDKGQAQQVLPALGAGGAAAHRTSWLACFQATAAKSEALRRRVAASPRRTPFTALLAVHILLAEPRPGTARASCPGQRPRLHAAHLRYEVDLLLHVSAHLWPAQLRVYELVAPAGVRGACGSGLNGRGGAHMRCTHKLQTQACATVVPYQPTNSFFTVWSPCCGEKTSACLPDQGGPQLCGHHPPPSLDGHEVSLHNVVDVH